MRALDLVVHRLADVVEQAGAFGLLHIQAQFRGHHAAQKGHFERVLEDVLAVTGAVLQAADQVDQVHVHAVGADIEGCLLAGLADAHLQVLGDLLHHFLDPRRVDAAVGNELFQRQPGHLAADRVEAGEDDRLGGVVDDDVDARGRLDGADIPAFPTDDASLHLVVGQGHHAHGAVGHVVAGVTGNGQGKDVLALAVGLELHLCLDAGQALGAVHARLAFDGLHELGLGLLAVDAGDLLQLVPLFVDQPLQLLFLLDHPLLADTETLLAVFQAGLLLFEDLKFALDLVEFPVEPALILLQLLTAGLQLPVALLLDLQGFLLGVEQGLLLDLLGFADRVFNDLSSLQGDVALIAFHQPLAQVDANGQSGHQISQGQKQRRYIQFHAYAPSALYEKTVADPLPGRSCRVKGWGREAAPRAKDADSPPRGNSSRQPCRGGHQVTPATCPSV